MTGLSPAAEQALQLVRLLYHVDLTVINDHQELEAFSNRFRFHALQYMFSPGSLRQLLRQLGEKQLYLLTDAFMIRIALFYVDGVPVIMGPFTSVLLTERDVRQLMQRFPVNDVSSGELLHYVNSFPCLPETMGAHIVASLLQVLHPGEQARELVRINYLEAPEFGSAEQMAVKREHYIPLLEKRYAHEAAFIQNIIEGNARKALQNLHSMQMDVAYLKRIGTTLENERYGSAIVQTTVRLAARQAGLPSIIIDQISGNNTGKVLRSSKIDEIVRAQEQMIREFCKAIQENRNEKLSALVQSAKYYIEKEYAEDISVRSLAEELEVSVNHLISVFKKEMQVTPNSYLREYRMKQAAHILAATDLPIQEVASSIGIPDANYMIKLFKAQYGETPAAYRKKYRV